MSLFKKFRKKRETSDKKEEISEGGLSEQDAGKKQAVRLRIVMNQRIYIY